MGLQRLLACYSHSSGSVPPLIVCRFVESYKGSLINQSEFERRQQSRQKGAQGREMWGADLEEMFDLRQVEGRGSLGPEDGNIPGA